MDRTTYEEMLVHAGVRGDGIGQFYEHREAQRPQPLQELRGYGAAQSLGERSSLHRVVDRSAYGALSVLTRSVRRAWTTVCALRGALDGIGHTDSDASKSAFALRDGAVTALEDLVKAAGFSMDSYFAEPRMSARDSFDSDCVSSSDSVSVLVIVLVGDLAAVKALAREVLPRVKKTGNTSALYDSNPEAIEKAVNELVAKADGLLAKMRDGVVRLAAELAKADT